MLVARAEPADVVRAGLEVALHRLADATVLVEDLDAEPLHLSALAAAVAGETSAKKKS